MSVELFIAANILTMLSMLGFLGAAASKMPTLGAISGGGMFLGLLGVLVAVAGGPL